MTRAEFGGELRRRRIRQGLTLGQLATLVHYSRSHLSKIENGHKTPSVQLSRKCDAVLSAGGELHALVSVSSGADYDAGSGLVAGEDPFPNWNLRLRSDGSGAFEIGETGTPTVTELPQSAAPSADTLPGLAALFEETKRLGRTSSPSMVLPVAITQAHVAISAAGLSAGRDRRDMLRHAARTAEFAGWMAQEGGDDRGSLWWTDRAVKLASAAGDEEMASYTLVRRAVVSLYRGDSSATTGFTETVLTDDTIHPRIRWLAALGAAQGYAIGLDHAGAMRALDTAASLYEQARGLEGEAHLGPSALHGRPLLIEAWCQYDLGNLAAAAALFERAMSLPLPSDRDRARFGTRRALVHAALGDPDRASELVGPLLDIVCSVDSATIRADLRDFARTITRFRGHRGAHEIQPALMAALTKR
ncbi:helix-turn-helix domain-containing protein [Nocardia rhizosphaerae]|uniref:Helix-turn-helix domain-containing protein n=1 Tax=Nocardia rhizosphaerae TaxID=1691571 RepID=A0ABV8L6V8_9NOCA